MKKTISAVLLGTLLAVVLTAPALAAGEDIVVFYTNDVHTYIDNAVEDEAGLT